MKIASVCVCVCVCDAYRTCEPEVTQETKKEMVVVMSHRVADEGTVMVE